MAFRVLAVPLLILLAALAEESKRLPVKRRLCQCGDHAIRIQVMDDEESSSISCNERCMAVSKDLDVTWSDPRRHILTRRELSREQKAVCKKMDKSDPRWVIENVKVTFHDRENDPGSNASGWYAEVSWKPFTDSPDRWSGYCLSYSAGSVEPVNSSLVPQNTTSYKIMPSWEKQEILISVVALPTSSSPSQNGIEQERIKMQLYRRGTLAKEVDTTKTFTSTTKGSSSAIAYVSISAGSLVGLFLVVCLLVYFLRRKKGNIPLPSDYKYHAFLIYNHEDILWTKELLTFLEEEHNLKCCIHYRNFEPGIAYPKNMAKSVYESYKVIAVFSKNFLKSNDCIYELDLAIFRRIKKHDNSLVVIRIDDVDSKYLPRRLKKINFIDYNSIWERPFWKHRLLTFLGFSQDYMERNGDGYQLITGRPAFGRLASTTSADSAISTI